jgi:predicted enzyme involved in methoxymalonyl-ACP biosynthesis
MGRGVESALLAFVAAEAGSAGARHLQGWYLPTEKNVVVSDCYARHGFELVHSEDAQTLWQLDLVHQVVNVPDWLTVRAPVLAN